MQLKILLPFKIFAEKSNVLRIVAKSNDGFIGIYPHRLDCALALAPGILTWETAQDGEVFVAVDEGILVKTGADVFISVRNAIGEGDLGTLHEAVLQNFINESEQEKEMRFALSKLESGFIHRFAEFKHG
jgi:F-type H+-transporting ATPase subunit epsilon